MSLKSPALAGGFFSTSTTREAPDSSGVEVEMNDWMNAEEWVLVQERTIKLNKKRRVVMEEGDDL